jgi:hypothetical protein
MTPDIGKRFPLLYIAIPIIGAGLMYYFYRKGFPWLKGKEGEDSVHSVLSHLPGGYYAIHDVTLGNTGNIDEVVITPKCLWTLEVKNLKGGEITFENESLCRNRYPIEGRNITEAQHEAKELQEFILTSLNLHVPVYPVIVFANPKNTMRFGFKDINGVQIIGIKWLQKLLHNDTMVDRLTQEQCRTIKDELKKYTSII